MECSFCGGPVARATGVLFVRKTGKKLAFCSKKCEKNLLKLGRNPRHVLWTNSFREEKELRLRGIKPVGKKEKAEEKKESEGE